MNESIALGKAVRDIRQSQQKSISQLAKELGCSTVMLSRLESGLASLSATMLQRIAKALDVSVDALHAEAQSKQEPRKFVSQDISACVALLEELSSKGQIDKAHSLLATALAEIEVGPESEHLKYA